MDRNRTPGIVDSAPKGSLNDLDARSRAIFREIVDTYLNTGEPVGSRTVSQRRGVTVSPATIRNVMSDLEHLGLLTSPHTSAGRIPTQLGLRMFVDALLEVGDITESERQAIAAQLAGTNKTLEDVLTQATSMLSGLSQCAGLVVTPTVESPLKHIEFLALGPGQALVVIVGENGSVENRVIDTPLGLTPSSLTEASNYLNAHVRGHTLSEARAALQKQIETARAELDALTAKLVEDGFALWSGGSNDQPQSLIVRGRANLLDNVEATADLERVRQLFDDLESKQDLIQLMQMAREGEGVRIFIGSENKLFSLSGSSLIVSPYRDSEKKIIGVLGVIGPTRLNYARVIPLVDYTAKVVGKIVS